MYKRPSRFKPPSNVRRPRTPSPPKKPSPPLEVKTVAARKIQNFWRRSRGATTFQWIMFSGNAEYKEKPNLESLYLRDLPGIVNEVSVRAGQDMQAVHTREYGFKKDVRTISYGSLMYKGMVGERAFALIVFKSGKVTFTGGYPDGARSMYQTPLSIVRQILGSGTLKNFKIATATIQMRTNLKLVKSFGELRQYLGRKFNQSYSAVEDSFITIKLDPEKLKIFRNGQFQIANIKSPARAKIASNRVKRLIFELARQGFYTQTANVPNKKRKTAAQKRHTGEIAPNIQKRSTTCPKDRRPDPYSFGGAPIGPDYYIGVNPQGLPCCYKIPKKTAYLRAKIIERFNELGIRIPESTKRAFAIQINNSSKPVNVSNKEPLDIPIFMDKGILKIGTRQAKRWPLVKLVDIAQKLGSTQIRGTISKDDVIDIIQQEARRKGILGQQNVMKINGRRNIRHFTKKNLYNRVKKVYGVRIDISKNMETLISNVRKLQTNAMSRRVFNEMVPSGPRVNENMRQVLRRAIVEDRLNEKNLRKKLRNALNDGLLNTIRRT